MKNEQGTGCLPLAPETQRIDRATPVFTRPTEITNPLLTMPDVIVTPHVASNTAAGIARMSESVVDQIIQLLAGQQPSFLIDPAAWPGRTRAGEVPTASG